MKQKKESHVDVIIRRRVPDRRMDAQGRSRNPSGYRYKKEWVCSCGSKLHITRINYFAKISPPWGELRTAKIVNLFREVAEPTAHSLELLDKDGEWISDEYYLAPFIYRGEFGAEEVDEAHAERIKTQLLRRWKAERSRRKTNVRKNRRKKR